MRVFIAIELDRGIRQRLCSLQESLGIAGNGVRWLTPEQMHLTLKFLGEAPDEDIAGVCDALREIAEETPPFNFEVAGAGCFPKSGPVRIVWAGINEPTGRLAVCQQLYEDVFAGLGFKQEHRAFAPHLTIGRVRESALSPRLREAVTRHGDFRCGRQVVEEMVLYQSVLKREGAEYVSVCRCPLGGEASGE
jgi:2'-5' RNA ligase